MMSVPVQDSLVFMFPGCFWKMQYHAIWHSIIWHLSPFSWERMVTEPTVLFSHQSEGQGDLCFSIRGKIFELITKLISLMRPRGHLSRGSSVPETFTAKKKKKRYISRGDLFPPDRSPGQLPHTYSAMVPSHTFWPCTTNGSWMVYVTSWQ